MTEPTSDLHNRLSRLDSARQAILSKMVDRARMLEPALRDAGLNHQADAVLALLIEYDANAADFQSTLKSNIPAFLELLAGPKAARRDVEA